MGRNIFPVIVVQLNGLKRRFDSPLDICPTLTDTHWPTYTAIKFQLVQSCQHFLTHFPFSDQENCVSNAEVHAPSPSSRSAMLYYSFHHLISLISLQLPTDSQPFPTFRSTLPAPPLLSFLFSPRLLHPMTAPSIFICMPTVDMPMAIEGATSCSPSQGNSWMDSRI